MNVLLSLALAMVFGLLLTRLAKLVHLPNVTAYLVAGLLVGPYCLNIMPSDSFGEISVITDVALGFIAFSIGTSFRLKHIREIGKSVIVITFFQALTTVLAVDAALIAMSLAGLVEMPVAITLGAIATATAPAATLMVVRQYRAHGIVTDTLLPVVAFDDAIGLVVFSVSFAIAKVLVLNEALTVTSTLVVPLIEIVLSLAVGGVLGLLLALSMLIFKSRANRISLCITMVFLSTALVEVFSHVTVFGENLSMSNLLSCMMMSAVYVNLDKSSDKIMDLMDRWTYPLFMLFFVISGAQLNLSIIPTVGLVGVVYLVVRSFGKYFGAFAGAAAVHADKHVRNYLGLTLLPQAGVAIGMAQIVANSQGFGEFGAQIQAVTLCATLVYELFGPILTKVALTKAGEIDADALAPHHETKA